MEKDEMYEEYIGKLKAAGLDDYIAEIQAQLDVYMNGN